MSLKAEKLQENDITKITFSGSIDEDSSQVLNELLKEKSQKITFSFEHIEYINSLGIRSWINFMKAFEKARNIAFEKCTFDLILQINTYPQFLGDAKVASFFCDFICPECNFETSQLFKSEDGLETILKKTKELKCEKCGNDMELDEFEETCFEFLKRT